MTYISNEAESFDNRITERIEAGFIPDIRRSKKCDFFYKSFWRDPYFIEIYIKTQINYYLNVLEKNSHPGAKILDVGCGSGYISLELARNGYHVTGIDISKKSIETAQRVLEENTFWDSFGSLNYLVTSILNIESTFDIILFSGVLHHIEDIGITINKAYNLLIPQGIIICREPCHEDWRLEDAAMTAIIRLLLSTMGLWYESELDKKIGNNEDAMIKYVHDIYDEYFHEKDPDEIAQSPNDNVTSGKEILNILLSKFTCLEKIPSNSNIYRLLGGIRGNDIDIYRIADLLSIYERSLVKDGIMKPNYFYYVGQKG